MSVYERFAQATGKGAKVAKDMGGESPSDKIQMMAVAQQPPKHPSPTWPNSR
jgi:hypothetical protein